MQTDESTTARFTTVAQMTIQYSSF